jgi:ketopantoate reductase
MEKVQYNDTFFLRLAKLAGAKATKKKEKTQHSWQKRTINILLNTLTTLLNCSTVQNSKYEKLKMGKK